MPDIETGDFARAVHKVRNIWASLPGAGYNQHEQKLTDLERAYRSTVDPRLNYEQALEIALLIARKMNSL